MVFLLIVCMLIILAGCATRQKPDISGGNITTPANTIEPTAIVSDILIRVAYCPTMEDHLPLLNLEGFAIEAFPYPNAAQALQAIISREVDAALIGRKPYTAEMVWDFVVLQLRDGVTLINAQQRVIPYSDLVSVTIHTMLSIQEAQGLFPEGTRIIHHTAHTPADLLDQDSAVLMDWVQVEGNYQLLTPVNEQGQKIPHFRTPFYVYPASFAEKLQAVIEKIPAS